MARAASTVVPMDPVKLIAADGSEIILDRRAAMVSGTIKSMLSGPGALHFPQYRPVLQSRNTHARMIQTAATECCLFCAGAGNFTEQQHGEVTFPDISAKVLEKTVQYFYYKLRHTNHSGPLPEFKIEPESALELLMAANFLDT